MILDLSLFYYIRPIRGKDNFILLFRVKNDLGFLPIDYAKNKSIKKLLTRVKLEEKSIIKKSPFDEELAYLSELQNMPNRPPKALGFVEKSGRMLPIFRKRYIEIDPEEGNLKRFKAIEDYPGFPNEVISLADIQGCQKTHPIYGNDFGFEFTINNTIEKYRVHNSLACDKWIEVINESILYSQFWRNMNNKYKSKKKKKDNAKKIEIIFIDPDSGRVKQNSIFPASAPFGKDSLLNNIERRQSDGVKKLPRKKLLNEDLNLIEDSYISKGIGFDSFEILEILGAGAFGKVFKVRLKETGEIFAMKVLEKKYLITNKALRYAITECNILKQVDHPFLIKLHFAFQTPDYLYMIIDYCPGGDLSFHISNTLFEEDEAKFYIGELILAIEYLHSFDIIYRDLKPENILIASDGHIKLADFGLCKEGIEDSSIAKSFCGTPAYLSPEMVNRKGVGKSADLYGIGAVLYEMISGTPPFYAEDLNSMYKNITSSVLMLHNYFSEELKDLLRRLLNRDPDARLGIGDRKSLREHKFFEGINWRKLFQKEITPPVDLNEMKREQMKGKESNYQEINFKDKDYNKDNFFVRQIKNFTFVRPESPTKKQKERKSNVSK